MLYMEVVLTQFHLMLFQGLNMLNVIYKSNGQKYSIPEDKYDPTLWEVDNGSPAAPPQQTTPQSPVSLMRDQAALPTQPPLPQDNSNLFTSIGKAIIDPATKFSRFATGGLIQAPLMALGAGNIKDAGIVKNTLLNNLLGLSEDELKRMGSDYIDKNGKANSTDRLIGTSKEAARRGAGAAGTAITASTGGAGGLLPTIAMGTLGGALQGASTGDEFDIGNVITGGAGGGSGAGLGYGAGKVIQGVLPKIGGIDPAVQKIMDRGDLAGKAFNFRGFKNETGKMAVNELAPYLAGALGGGGLGAFKGKNLGSTLGGIGSGLALAAVLKNPQALSKIAAGLGKTGQALPAIMSKTGESVGVGANEFFNESDQNQSSGLIPEAEASSPEFPAITSPITNQPAPVAPPSRTVNPYGLSVEQLDQMRERALQAGDDKSATLFNDAILKEVDYQRKEAEYEQKISPKNKENTHATTAASASSDVRKALGLDKPGGTVNKRALLEMDTPGSSVLGVTMDQLMTQYTQSQSMSGRYTPQQVEANATKLKPQWWESPAVVKKKLDLIDKAINDAMYLSPIGVANDAADYASAAP